jgi:hypothetical protein
MKFLNYATKQWDIDIMNICCHHSSVDQHGGSGDRTHHYGGDILIGYSVHVIRAATIHFYLMQMLEFN